MAIVLTIYVVMSIVTLIAFGLDKRAARRRGAAWRTPESTLHMLELLGGFPGALLGQRFFRHKSSKVRYRAVLWSIIGLHALAWIWWLAR